MRTALPWLTIVVAVASPSQAQTTSAPATQYAYPTAPIVRLWPGDPPATQAYDEGDKIVARRNSTTSFNLSGVAHASLMVYPPAAPTTRPAPAVIVCPGGGYGSESLTPEGVEVAQRFAADGVAGFVLRYRLPNHTAPAADALPVPQQDVLRAIQVVRSRAAEFGVDPTKVGVVGFSAGGHLAATAATMYGEASTFANRAQDDATSKVSARPDFAVLLYPVVTMSKSQTHGGSRNALIGGNAPADVRDRFSVELHVTETTPPLFIVHAKDDKTVPVANAEYIAAAAANAGVPHELVLFDTGGHGFALGVNAETKAWYGKCVAWMRAGGFLPANP